MIDKPNFEKLIGTLIKIRSNNRYSFYVTDELEYKTISSSQRKFIRHLSELIGGNFEQIQRDYPKGNPVGWYTRALDIIVGEYFKEDEGIKDRYSLGVKLVETDLAEEIFDKIIFYTPGSSSIFRIYSP